VAKKTAKPKVEKAKYIPGVCNIGPQERKLRKIAGWIGILVTLALAVYFHLSVVPQAAKLFIFLPALVGSVGLLQYYQHFCVNFGMRGLFNVNKEAFKTDTVDQAKYRKMDQAKALQIIFIAVAISLGVTLLVYFF
jgi:hypothetical protein